MPEPRPQFRKSVARIGRVRRKVARMYVLQRDQETFLLQKLAQSTRDLSEAFSIDLAGFAVVGWSFDGTAFTAMHAHDEGPYSLEAVPFVCADLLQGRVDHG